MQTRKNSHCGRQRNQKRRERNFDVKLVLSLIKISCREKNQRDSITYLQCYYRTYLVSMEWSLQNHERTAECDQLSVSILSVRDIEEQVI